MHMKYSFRIFSAWGIPIELHLTFVLLIVAVLFLSVFSVGNLYPFALILFLFVFVVFHELAHSLVARHYRIRVRKIVLYPIGGVSEIEEIPENPGIEWRLAIAGPATSLLIGVVLLALNQLVVVAAPVTAIGGPLATAGALLFDLGGLNLVLGAFNLIPAFPMDGGRVFRALLAERMKFTDATKYAAYIGRIFGIAMVVFGIVFPSYFLLIVVGLFVYIGASEEAEQTIVSTTLARVRVKDVMRLETASVSPGATVAEAIEVAFKARYHDVLVEKDGDFQGTICWDELNKISLSQRASIRVTELPLKYFSVQPDESVLEAQKILTREKVHLVPVVDPKLPTRVVGVLTSEGVAKAYEVARNLR